MPRPEQSPQPRKPRAWKAVLVLPVDEAESLVKRLADPGAVACTVPGGAALVIVPSACLPQLSERELAAKLSRRRSAHAARIAGIMRPFWKQAADGA